MHIKAMRGGLDESFSLENILRPSVGRSNPNSMLIYDLFCYNTK